MGNNEIIIICWVITFSIVLFIHLFTYCLRFAFLLHFGVTGLHLAQKCDIVLLQNKTFPLHCCLFPWELGCIQIKEVIGSFYSLYEMEREPLKWYRGFSALTTALIDCFLKQYPDFSLENKRGKLRKECMKSSSMAPPPLPKQGLNSSMLEGWYHQQVGQCVSHNIHLSLRSWHGWNVMANAGNRSVMLWTE